jgi:flagellar basal-body rod protein FlgC
MSIESVMEATRVGLSYERLRMDAASRNIAAANMPIAPDSIATSAQITGAADDFAAHMDDNGGFEIQQLPIGIREMQDPGSPFADAKGMVHYPAIDLVQEMTTMLTASRGYEANVRAFNLLRSMIMKANDIGSR